MAFVIPTTTIRTTYPPTPQIAAIPYQPLYTVSKYDDVNNDLRMQLKITKYFYEVIKESWIKLYFKKLLKYFKVNNGLVDIIKSKNEMTNPNDDYILKRDYIMKHVLTSRRISMLINNYRKIKYINWWDVKKHQNNFAKYIYVQLKIYLKKKMNAD